MKKFKVTMVRVYTTEFMIDAKSEKGAEKKMHKMVADGSAYETELEECNVDESFDIQEVKGKRYKFARKCDITGEGMNEGWCIGGGEMYIKYRNDVRKWVKDNLDMTLEEAYENDDDGFYWTSWEDEDEYEYESDSPEGKDATEIEIV